MMLELKQDLKNGCFVYGYENNESSGNNIICGSYQDCKEYIINNYKELCKKYLCVSIEYYSDDNDDDFETLETIYLKGYKLIDEGMQIHNIVISHQEAQQEKARLEKYFEENYKIECKIYIESIDPAEEIRFSFM